MLWGQVDWSAGLKGERTAAGCLVLRNGCLGECGRQCTDAKEMAGLPDGAESTVDDRAGVSIRGQGDAGLTLGQRGMTDKRWIAVSTRDGG